MPNATMDTTHATATQTPARGFAGVPCIRCGDTGNLSMTVDNVTSFTCSACDAEFSDDGVREHMAGLQRWVAVLKWVDLAPVAD